MTQPLFDKPGQPVIGHYENRPSDREKFESMMKFLGYSIVDVTAKQKKPTKKKLTKSRKRARFKRCTDSKQTGKLKGKLCC
jgi:hypothetical protein